MTHPMWAHYETMERQFQRANQLHMNRKDRRASAAKQRRVVTRDADPLTLTAGADPIYGSTPLFDLCANDALVSLSMTDTPLVSWIGAENNNNLTLVEHYITYMDAAGTGAGSPTSSALADPCAPGALVEWGKCDFSISGFGRHRRASAVRDLTVDNVRYCQSQPTYRLDGSPINNELEWDMVNVATALNHDISRNIITGNATTPGQFDGLARLIRYGITNLNTDPCPAMDSTVIDWAGNGICGDDTLADITVNNVATTGAALGGSFIAAMMRYVRRVQYRVRMSQFGNRPGSLRNGDIAIVMPYEYINCLLDCWTCFTKCGNDITRIDSYEARQFRDSLNGGAFGDGQLLNFEGLNIPIIAHDYGMINANGTFQVYVLVRAINGQPVLRLQTLDMAVARQQIDGARVTDGGRFLSWVNIDNTCRQLQMEIRPRLVLRAPWAQISFLNVACTNITGVISADPQSTRFIGRGTAGLQ